MTQQKRPTAELRARRRDREMRTDKRLYGKRRVVSSVGTVVIIALITILMSPGTAMADHQCIHVDPVCRTEFHGFNTGSYDRDINDWVPVRADEVGSHDWHTAYAENTGPRFAGSNGNYHYTYATGGRLLDSHAYWDFTRARQENQRPRGVYRLYMRVPEGKSATVPATATVYYNVFIRENGEDRLATSFVIDQRRAQGWRGWIDSGRELVLKSPERVRVTVSDVAAWPDYDQAGTENAVIAVDAAALQHRKFLPEDRSYAQLQCASKLNGRPSGLTSLAQNAEWSTYGSAALSVGGTLIGLTPVVTPVGSAIIGTAIALADPLSVWINGETLWGAVANARESAERLDAGAFLRAATLGGEWERSPKFNWLDPLNLLSSPQRRWYNLGNPGPCQLLPKWERYLPPGA